MKLDRNINKNGIGKYALVKLRDGVPPLVDDGSPDEPYYKVPVRQLDFGNTPETDFFVIRLKDKYAAEALQAYALAIGDDDPEYAKEMHDLAHIASKYKNPRKPD